ncbi:TetR/AcrR family transcriptional regulator [Labedaea rhizosphaerae]|uniref:TetR family transcriptional regulator n=1 Tax=Labedaea rhizosphaerae TaxID=598644 RepID=A0A4R6SHE6_LABRH|nr:TetR/AcrR family transcriptional regulator [Labedaea rhizosphaerae]TDQ01037.1 TetR family transcriptional regulator [Labedaea rhizosphaerae]
MTGLRERKKQATREALREAALRLALERGPDNVRVDDIAEAAGVSPRTYNNYFAGRDHAIVAAVTAERESRIAAAVAASSAPLASAVVEAVVAEHHNPGERGRDTLLLITTHPSLRAAYADSAESLEGPLADAIAARIDDTSTATVLAACVAAAVRVGLQQWLGQAQKVGALVVPPGPLEEPLRAALAPLAPALTAAEKPA